ncbi:MAG: class I SAM-dependent methyltransferase [Candidatus Thiodiazotropha endolucinida]
MTRLDELNAARFGQPVFAPFDDGSQTHAMLAQQLKATLKSHGFDAIAIAARLGVAQVQSLPPHLEHILDRCVLSHDELGILIRLFVLNLPLTQYDVSKVFNSNLRTFLIDIGALVVDGGKVQSVISLFCLDDYIFAADSFAYDAVWAGEVRAGDRVMYLGHDSLGLALTAPRFKRRNALDLCCGSGVQAIVARSYSEHVVGVDINPRALRFARFNAAMNAVDGICFVEGDLYDPVDGETFDAILANPPFVPAVVNDPALMFRDAGATGESVLTRILAGAEKHGTPDRVLSLVADFINLKNYAHKLVDWQLDQFRTFMFIEDESHLVDYAIRHTAYLPSIQERQDKAVRMLQHFTASNIHTIHFGYLIQTGAEGNLTIHELKGPIGNIIETDVRRVLEGDGVRFSETAKSSRPRLTPGVRIVVEIGRSHESEEEISIFAETPDSDFLPRLALSSAVYQLLEKLREEQPLLCDIRDEEEQRLITLLLDQRVLTLSSDYYR